MRISSIRRILGAMLLTLPLVGCFELPLAEFEATPSEQPFREAEFYDSANGVTIHARAVEGGAYVVWWTEASGAESDDVEVRIWGIAPSLYVAAAPKADQTAGEEPVAFAGVLMRDGDSVSFFPACGNDSMVELAAAGGAEHRKEGWITYCRFEMLEALFDYARALAALDLDAPVTDPLRNQTLSLDIVRFVE